MPQIKSGGAGGSFGQEQEEKPMEKRPELLKKNRGKYVVGYDLSDSYAQISYAPVEEGEPETISTITGAEQYQIPAVLFRKEDTGQWLYGKEALNESKTKKGHLIEHLLTRARDEELLKVGEEEFELAALLTLFVKRSLSLLAMTGPLERMEGLMFTVDELDKETIRLLQRIGVNLGLRTEQIYVQSHVESFYYFMLNQPKELWYSGVLLFDYDNIRMKVYDFYCNQRTTPIVVLIETTRYDEMDRAKSPEQSEEGTKRWLDQSLFEISPQHLKGRKISSVYFIGEGYRDDWADTALRYLVQGRRGFRGNNLFGKGACYGIRERLGTGPVGRDYVFLGLDRLKANIGMRVLRKGELSYFAIMDAGINWFDAKASFDLILESGESVSVVITPVDGKEPREIHMILEGLPQRPERTTRLHMEARMESENRLEISVTDRGFGELFPATDAKWLKLFEV